MKTILEDIPSREAFFKGEQTLKVGYPWLTFGAIVALEAIVKENFKVLEFGSGGSTLFFARRCLSVNSFETSSRWFERVKRKIGRRDNIHLTLADQETMLRAVNRDPDDHYHLVLVDCQPQRNRRLLLANASIPKLKTGGWLVVDNYSRYSMNDFDYSGWRVYTFDEVGYTGGGTRLCQKI